MPEDSPRDRLLADLAARIPSSTGTHCIRVAVDGVDGVGKTTFADGLAAALRRVGREVIRVSADDFLNPRAVRYRQGRDSPLGFFLDSYDYAALRARVLDPLGPGGTRRYLPASHDLGTDHPLEPAPRVASAEAVLVLDGLFLHRDELAGCWDFSVFLDAPFEVTVARLAARDGSHPDPGHPTLARYVEGQRLYFARCSPRTRATVVIDNSEAGRPVVTRG